MVLAKASIQVYNFTHLESLYPHMSLCFLRMNFIFAQSSLERPVTRFPRGHLLIFSTRPFALDSELPRPAYVWKMLRAAGLYCPTIDVEVSVLHGAGLWRPEGVQMYADTKVPKSV